MSFLGNPDVCCVYRIINAPRDDGRYHRVEAMAIRGQNNDFVTFPVGRGGSSTLSCAQIGLSLRFAQRLSWCDSFEKEVAEEFSLGDEVLLKSLPL